MRTRSLLVAGAVCAIWAAPVAVSHATIAQGPATVGPLACGGSLTGWTGCAKLPRHGPPPNPFSFGKCEPAKHGFYADAACRTKDIKREMPRGKYEWFPSPVGCFAMKKGRYAESGCATVDEKKGKPKGKYELGVNSFSGTSGAVTIEIAGVGSVKCATGELEATIETTAAGSASITLSECAEGGERCTSSGQNPGTIVAAALEFGVYEELGKTYAGLNGEPVAQFSCGGEAFTISGWLAGEATGDIDLMSTTGQWAFGAAIGEQMLTVSHGAVESEGMLTGTIVTSSPQGFEILG